MMTLKVRYIMKENMPMRMARRSGSKYLSFLKAARSAPSPAPTRRICEARLGRKLICC
jgi:hypothetical protein